MLRQLQLTPWKVINELRRYSLLPLARLYFAFHGISWQAGWRLYGLPLIQRHGGSTISIGRNLQMRNWFSANPLGVNHPSILATWSSDATIEIGDHVGLTGTTICAQTAIRIGNRVRVGANSTIVDTDFHPLTVYGREQDPKAGKSAPVIIEDDVFIGMAVLILKGSHIGRGSVIGAGSVVAGSIPPGVIVAGNPARIIRELPNEERFTSKDPLSEHV
jgi:acetyltransferase-like isoleucine patch superfamily enzyme